MVRIDFHFNAPDKHVYVCRLARKARAAGRQLVIYSSDAQLLSELDRQLWTFSEFDFLPHCAAGDALAARTPILLLGDDTEDSGPELPHHEVLINLDHRWPPLFTRFERLIEIVTTDNADREAGRRRWKFYKDRGYDLTPHDQARHGQ